MELHPKYSPYPGGQAVTYNRAQIIKVLYYIVLYCIILLNFIPEFENLEFFSPAASLIFKNIHQMLKNNSELYFNDLNCKSCLRNLHIKASRIAL